jgi:hypothetical protein
MEQKETLSEQLKKMAQVDVKTVDPAELVEIEDVKISGDLSKEDRVLDYIRQIKNPYVYKCGDIIVKATFSDTDETLEDRMEHYLRNR